MPQVVPSVALHAALAAEEPAPGREGNQENGKEDVKVVVERIAGVGAGAITGGGDVDVGGDEGGSALCCFCGSRGGGIVA